MGGTRLLCLRCAPRHPPVLRRALLTSLVVGTALTLINQGDALVTATLTPVLIWKIPLTYFVPFAVSTYSALAISRDMERRERPEPGA
ncbi:MAG: nitrate/nitrite transporter NrtS [Vicinamibacterales bacterium]